MVERIKRILLPIAVMMLLSGCAVMEDPKAELLVAQRSFITIVNSLAELRAVGAFEESEIKDIGKLIESGDTLLDEWTASALAGERSPQIISLFNAVIGELFDYEKKGD